MSFTTKLQKIGDKKCFRNIIKKVVCLKIDIYWKNFLSRVNTENNLILLNFQILN